MACCHPNQSTKCMCGDFEEPENPDLGQCAPYRVKTDCEAPTIPTISDIAYNPNANPPFTVE